MPTTIGVLDKDGAAQTVNTLPALGSAADAASLPVSKSTEDKAVSAAAKTAVETVATNLPAKGQAAMAASTPVAIASDQTAVAVKTSAIVISQEVTRPADTTAYSANDVINNSASSPAVGVLSDFFSANGASGYLAKFELWTDQAANVIPYRIHLFNAAPTAINDNAAFTLLYADISKYVGYVDISVSQEGSGSTAAFGFWTGQMLITAAAAANDLYYVITAKSAFTPASGQKFTARGSLDANG